MFPNLVSDNNGIYSISVKDKKLPNSKVAKLSQVAPLSSILGFDLDSSDFVPETTPSSSSASSLVMNRADDTNQDNEHKSISAIYKPVVYTCRILGVCPIHIVESCEGISYNFVLFSLNTLLSGTISGLVISFYVWWLRAQGRPLHWHYLEVANNHEANNETVEWIVAGKTDPGGQCHSSLMSILYKVLPLQMPFITCANIIIAFTSAPKFSQILCEFKQFEKRFQEKLQTTKFPFSTSLPSARCKIALFYLIFGGMYCILVIFVTRPKCTKMYCPTWRKVAGALVVFPYITYTFMEDFKYLLLFRTLEEGFLQIALKIQEFNNESNSDKEIEAKLIGLPKLVS